MSFMDNTSRISPVIPSMQSVILSLSKDQFRLLSFTTSRTDPSTSLHFAQDDGLVKVEIGT